MIHAQHHAYHTHTAHYYTYYTYTYTFTYTVYMHTCATKYIPYYITLCAYITL